MSCMKYLLLWFIAASMSGNMHSVQQTRKERDCDNCWRREGIDQYYACVRECVYKYVCWYECVTISQRVKHSKLTDGIDKAVTENKKLIPAGIDHDQVPVTW